eukprot:748935-Prymnesium_polylepis.2
MALSFLARVVAILAPILAACAALRAIASWRRAHCSRLALFLTPAARAVLFAARYACSTCSLDGLKFRPMQYVGTPTAKPTATAVVKPVTTPNMGTATPAT